MSLIKKFIENRIKHFEETRGELRFKKNDEEIGVDELIIDPDFNSGLINKTYKECNIISSIAKLPFPLDLNETGFLTIDYSKWRENPPIIFYFNQVITQFLEFSTMKDNMLEIDVMGWVESSEQENINVMRSLKINEELSQ